MTIDLVKSGGWSVGEELTSPQIEGIDANTTYALDKRSGETDTLASIVTCTGAGRIVNSYVAGANADTTYIRGTAAGIIDASSGLTAARAYTLSNTGASAGDVWTVLGNPTYDVTVKNAAASTLLVLAAGSTGQSRWAEFLFNGTAWVLFKSSHQPQRGLTTFTANGNYTVPADCYMLLVLGAGGGGGGGGGSGGGSTDNISCCAGAGGGAAMLGATFVSTTPGTVFAVTIASGGAGGAGVAGASAAGTGQAGEGADGGDTTFGSTLTFRGGQGGGSAYAVSGTNTTIQYTRGGGPVAGSIKYPSGTSTPASLILPPFGVNQPGEGGYGISYNSVTGPGGTGGKSAVASTLAGSGTTTPGTGGALAVAGGSKLPGGGGGGGGASAVGNGANGGAGGNGNAGGVGVSGTNGSSAAANSAAGGGGGGGGGFGTVIGSVGGTGGTGGSGVLIVIPVR
jgi:hypothetical protein